MEHLSVLPFSEIATIFDLMTNNIKNRKSTVLSLNPFQPAFPEKKFLLIWLVDLATPKIG